MAVELVKKIDLIAREFGLNYKGDTKYRSLVGGTLSFIIIILTFIGLFYFGRELYEKSSPYLISSTSYNTQPSNTSLSPTNFPFYLAVEDASNNLEYFKDETVYEMTARKYTRLVYTDQQGNINVNVTKTPIKLEDCELKRHFPGMEDVFSKHPVSKAWCIRPEDNHYIKGDFNVDEFYELQFYVKTCLNRTSNNNHCKNQAEIAKRLDSGYVVYNFGYYYNSPKNFTNPLIRLAQDYFTKISTYTYKRPFHT
jgi:hypothetical protein